MIPKIIHYCWFGKGLMPESQRKCIETWKKFMPEYEIKRWDENNFDYEKYAFSSESYKIGKYSFVSDMCRLYVLNRWGGYYMDTDVELFCSLDKYSNFDFVSGLEVFPEFQNYKNLLDGNGHPLDSSSVFGGGCGMLAAVVGAAPNNPIIKETFEYYSTRQLYNQNQKMEEYPIIDGYLAHIALKYGYRYQDIDQLIGDEQWVGKIVNSSVFLCYEQPLTGKAELIHHAAQSWKPKTKRQQFELNLDKLGLLKYYNILKRFKHRFM